MQHAVQPNGAPPSGYQPQSPNRAPEFPSMPPTSPGQFSTAPSLPSKGYQTGPDEFGYGRPEVNGAATAPTRTGVLPSPQEEPASPPSHLRPSAGRRTNNNNRFTITNLGDEDEPPHASGASQPSPTHSVPRKQWLTAEEEKKRLYEEANAKVAIVQGSVALHSPPADESPVCSYETHIITLFADLFSYSPPLTAPPARQHP